MPRWCRYRSWIKEEGDVKDPNGRKIPLNHCEGWKRIIEVKLYPIEPSLLSSRCGSAYKEKGDHRATLCSGVPYTDPVYGAVVFVCEIQIDSNADRRGKFNTFI